MATGRIKFFNLEKGYGFITDTEVAQDFFFHVSGVLEDVKQDDEVNFNIVEGDRGKKAIDVQKVK